MNIITSFLKKNPCYIANQEFTPKGIMVSMVGCPQPSAKVFINNWNRESCDKVCPHILIDANDGKVYQTLPYSVRGRYKKPDIDESGKIVTETDKMNDYLQVFLCEPSQIKYQKGETFSLVGDKDRAIEAVNRVYHSAIGVCSDLCRIFEFDTMTQIVSPEQGKNNPKEPNAFWRQLSREDAIPYMMSALKCSVENDLKTPPVMTNHLVKEDSTSEETSIRIGIDLSNDPDYTVANGEGTSKPSFSVGPINSFVINAENEKAKDEVFEYPDEYQSAPSEFINIRIDVPNLRIRKGPGTGEGCEPIGKYTGIGQFQITEIQNGSGNQKGWGKLASGEGWVSMDFVTVL